MPHVQSQAIGVARRPIQTNLSFCQNEPLILLSQRAYSGVLKTALETFFGYMSFFSGFLTALCTSQLTSGSTFLIPQDQVYFASSAKLIFFHGGVAEWLKAADCKSARVAYVGSNPTPTTITQLALICDMQFEGHHSKRIRDYVQGEV